MGLLGCLQSSNLDYGYHFPADFYLSALNEFLEKEKKVCRFKSKHFDLVLRPFTNELKFSFSFQGDESYKFGELLNSVKTVSDLMTRGESKLIEVYLKNQCIPLGKLSTTNRMTDLELERDLSYLKEILQHNSIPMEEITLVLNNFHQYSSVVQIMHLTMFGDPKTVRLSNPNIEEDNFGDTLVAFVLPLQIRLECLVISSCPVFSGFIRTDANGVRYCIPEKVESGRVVISENGYEQQQLHELARVVIDKAKLDFRKVVVHEDLLC